ncbi:MAG: hypothetical protein ABI662_05700 [Dermatophilaceae bacterium]
MSIQLPQSARRLAGRLGEAPALRLAVAVEDKLAPVAAVHPVGATAVRSRPSTPLALVYSSAKTPLRLVVPVSENPGEHLCEIPDAAGIDHHRPGLTEAAYQPGTGPRPGHHRPQSLS